MLQRGGRELVVSISQPSKKDIKKNLHYKAKMYGLYNLHINELIPMKIDSRTTKCSNYHNYTVKARFSPVNSAVDITLYFSLLSDLMS
jgi:hypothetical protein